MALGATTLLQFCHLICLSLPLLRPLYLAHALQNLDVADATAETTRVANVQHAYIQYDDKKKRKTSDGLVVNTMPNAFSILPSNADSQPIRAVKGDGHPLTNTCRTYK